MFLMKLLPIAIIAPCLAFAAGLDRATPAPSEPPITQAEAGSIKTLSLKELAVLAPSSEGKIVKVKFTHVSGVLPGKNGEVIATLYDKEWMSVAVRVPKEGAPWLSKLPSTETNKSFFVFGRVEKEGKFQTFSQLKLLGRELRIDIKRATFIW